MSTFKRKRTFEKGDYSQIAYNWIRNLIEIEHVGILLQDPVIGPDLKPILKHRYKITIERIEE